MGKKGKEPEPTLMTLEDILTNSGHNIIEAKSQLAQLKAAFSAGVGGIPEGALSRWANARGDGHDLWMALGRAWEKEV